MRRRRGPPGSSARCSIAITVEERFGSPRITTGPNPGVERDYLIDGAADEVQAHNALLAETPLSYDPWGSGVLFLPRTGVAGLQQIGEFLYEATVHYSAATPADGQTFEFDTTGGRIRRMHSLQTKGRYARPAKTAKDYKGAIGVNGDTVEGVEVPVPAFAFSVTRRIAPDLVTPDYLDTLEALTGVVNDRPIAIQYEPSKSKVFPAGELRFLGVRGGLRGIEGYSLTFFFERSHNDDDVEVGDIVGPIEKGGWDYLWIEFVDDVDTVAKGPVKVPGAVYVEQVSPEEDLTALGLLA
jgi:hypothetical protein